MVILVRKSSYSLIFWSLSSLGKTGAGLWQTLGELCGAATHLSIWTSVLCGQKGGWESLLWAIGAQQKLWTSSARRWFWIFSMTTLKAMLRMNRNGNVCPRKLVAVVVTRISGNCDLRQCLCEWKSDCVKKPEIETASVCDRVLSSKHRRMDRWWCYWLS